MNFIETAEAYAKTMPLGAPPIAVSHPNYGLIGSIDRARGFKPPRGRWLTANAILRDANRNAVKLLDRFERQVPNFAKAGVAAAIAGAMKEPMGLPVILAAISNYDGIVAARGSGALQDVWMQMTATYTAVSGVWLDSMQAFTFQPMTAPTVTGYVNASTAGSVLDATSNGSWLTNPAGTNKKYIVSMGITVTSLSGFALSMLCDCLWAGSYALTTNATIAPTTPVAVTRWANTTPGNADFAGGNMMQCALTTTLTHTVAPVNTVTYTDQAGTASKTMSSTCPATGPLAGRILFNTTQASATVIPSTPFMPLTNAGSSGVTKVQQVVISGGTATVGTVTHKIVRPLVIMPFIAANSYIEQDTTLNIGNMVELHNVSQVCGCLFWNILCGAGTTAASMSALMRTVEG